MTRPLPASTVSGLGVHSGRPCVAVLRPGAPGTGIRFRPLEPRSPTSPPVAPVAATLDHVLGSTMAVALGDEAFSVSTPEHLLSACAGLGIYDLDVAVAGPELPIGDGSAAPWLRALDQLLAAGHGPDAEYVQSFHPAPRPALRLAAPVEVWDGDRLARLAPQDGDALTVTASLSPRAGLARLGPTTVTVGITPADYRADVAWARTFAYAEDAERLQAMGYGAGADLDNTVLVTVDGCANPGGTRGSSEPVRHKILDALGDLALLGRPVVGHLTLVDSGHSLHLALARALAAVA